jgi:hypothetical protein
MFGVKFVARTKILPQPGIDNRRSNQIIKSGILGNLTFIKDYFE